MREFYIRKFFFKLHFGFEQTFVWKRMRKTLMKLTPFLLLEVKRKYLILRQKEPNYYYEKKHIKKTRADELNCFVFCLKHKNS